METVNLGLQVSNGQLFNGTSFASAAVERVAPAMTGPYLPIDAYNFPTWQPPVWGFDDFNPYGGVGPNGTSTGGVKKRNLRALQVTTELSADQLLGAEVEGRTTSGKTALLKITGIASGSDRNSDLIYYVVHAAAGVDWVPLCGQRQGEPIPALAVPGYWNHRQGTDGGKWLSTEGFSFVCRGSSVAKCMEAGYKPWVDPASRNGAIQHRGRGQLAEANHLQACVRMLRADYCGDGTSHTQNGRQIDVWDTMRIHTRSRQDWPFEAAWDQDGAVWMDRARLSSKVPACLEEKLAAKGTVFNRQDPERYFRVYRTGGRVMNGSPTP